MSEPNMEQMRVAVLEVLNRMHPDARSLGVILIGSLAQGLGNDLSDIDLVAIDFSNNKLGVPSRQFTHIGSQRCEVYFMSLEDLHELAARFEKSPEEYNAWEASGLYYRIAFGLPLQNERQTKQATTPFSKKRTAELLTAVHSNGIQRGVNEAMALNRLGFIEEAAAAARGAIGHLLKSLVSRTECFAVTGSKYLETQLSRCVPKKNYALLLELWRKRLPADPENYTSQCFAQIKHAGCSIAESSTTVRFRLDEDVRVLRFVDKSLILNSGTVFLINPLFEASTLSLVHERECEVLQIADPDELFVLHDFYENGLAVIECGTDLYHGGVERLKTGSTNIDLGAEGPRWPQNSTSVLMTLEFTPKVLVELCCCIFLQVIIYANSKEDVVGAIRLSLWSQVEVKLRDMMIAIGVIALANRGTEPHDTSSVADARIYKMLRKDDTNVKIAELFYKLMQISVDDKEGALTAVNLVETATELLPSHILEKAGRCMEDGQIHDEIIFGLGNKLAGLAKEVNATRFFSIGHEKKVDERSFVHDTQDTTGNLWSRNDDMRRELSKI